MNECLVHALSSRPASVRHPTREAAETRRRPRRLLRHRLHRHFHLRLRRPRLELTAPVRTRGRLLSVTKIRSDMIGLQKRFRKLFRTTQQLNSLVSFLCLMFEGNYGKNESN